MTGSSKIGLALAGGGPLGAIYEIGALCALEDSLSGLDLTRLHHYVGVSAGGFIAAGLANGLSPRELSVLFIESQGGSGRPSLQADADRFDPANLMAPANDEFLRRAMMLPGQMASAWWRLAVERKSLIQVLEHLSAVLPTGVFSNEQVHIELSKLFAKPGRSNDFRHLRSKLTLVATNLDNGEPVAFGRPGQDHVPISRAVQASAALPGLFPPVEIDDQCYVDGALKKTMHASVALEDGVDLLLCLNPLVPFDATLPQFQRVMRRGLPRQLQRVPRIVEGGLPSVLSQAFRTMIHSRLEMGMKAYHAAYPQTDILLFEPDHRDPTMYLANTFSYARRRDMAEHAYQHTRQWLRSHSTVLASKLSRHGIRLNHAHLDDAKAHLVKPLPAPTRVGRALSSLQDVMEDLSSYVVQQNRPNNSKPNNSRLELGKRASLEAAA